MPVISLPVSFTKLLGETLHFGLFLFGIVRLIQDEMLYGKKVEG
jgi:hypothetical protein